MINDGLSRLIVLRSDWQWFMIWIVKDDDDIPWDPNLRIPTRNKYSWTVGGSYHVCRQFCLEVRGNHSFHWFPWYWLIGMADKKLLSEQLLHVILPTKLENQHSLQRTFAPLTVGLHYAIGVLMIIETSWVRLGGFTPQPSDLLKESQLGQQFCTWSNFIIANFRINLHNQPPLYNHDQSSPVTITHYSNSLSSFSSPWISHHQPSLCINNHYAPTMVVNNQPSLNSLIIRHKPYHQPAWTNIY